MVDPVPIPGLLPLVPSEEDLRGLQGTQPSKVAVSQNATPRGFSSSHPSLVNPLFQQVLGTGSSRRPTSLLERAALPPFRNTSATRVGAAIDQGIASLTRPSSVALFYGSRALYRIVGEWNLFSQISFTPERISASPNWRLAAAVILPIAAAGCEIQYGNHDGPGGLYDATPPPDGGTSGVDQDGDGYSRGVDCNDGDPTTHPLPANGGLVTINSSTTICPGTYRGVQIVIPSGSTGVHLTGNGVTLDGNGITQYAIQMDGVNGATVEGFTIRNYNADPGSV